MGRLALIIVFYWVLLLENGTGLLGAVVDFGGGMELRVTLILKLIFLLINLLTLLYFHKKHSIPKYLVVISLFLFISTLYVLYIDPEKFIRALSINLHIQLMLNIILFIKFNSYSPEQISSFYKYLRVFALLNASMVIVSYFLPDLMQFFESGISKTGVTRAFGIMGDEVSVFLTFFLFDSLIFKRPLSFILFFTAIVFTAGLGASFTAITLIIYYVLFILKKTKKNLLIGVLTILFLVPSGFFYRNYSSGFGIFQRTSNILNNTRGESASLRLLSLQVAQDMIKSRPFLGYGFGNYSTAVIKKYKPKFVNAGKGKFFEGSAMVIMGSTFNPYLQMLAEGGIIGLLFFIWFLFKMYKSTYINFEDKQSDAYKINQTSRGWLVIFFLTTLSANWFLPSSFLFLLVVSLVGINIKLKQLTLDEYSQETV